MPEDGFTKVGHFKNVQEFRAHFQSLGVDLPIDDRVLSADEDSPMAQPIAERGLVALLRELTEAHRASFGANATDDLLIGLQLTHSGRFCKPDSHFKLEPRIAYHHPILDPKFKIASDDDSVVLSDDYLDRL